MRTARFLFLALIATSLGATQRVDREIARLEQTLKTAEAGTLPEDVRPLFEGYRAALERAKRATPAEYQLYRLRDPFVGAETLAFLAKEHKSAESVETFQRLWEKNRARFTASAPKPKGTLLQRGLSESATTRAERLYRASLPYAKASAPWSGVYYLGEAEANLRFREFVQSLANEDRGAAEKAPTRAWLAAMLDGLEGATLKFFGKDVTNQQVVPVSVRLKETHELLDAGRLDGATLLLVEARAALSRRGGPKGTYPQAAPRSGSIVSVLQGWAADEEAPMSDALRQEVVPFHAALYTSAAAPATAARAAQVTVTLVRWPYT